MLARAVAAPAVLLLALAGGCSATADDGAAGSGSEGDKVTVVAAFYPLQFVAEQVGGDRVEVSTLVKPGTEPHDLELTPQQVGEIGDADVVAYLAGFQPAVDEAVSNDGSGKRFDAAAVQPLRDGYTPIEEGVLEEDEKGKDPHIWLDPTRLAAVATAMATALGEVDEAGAADYKARAAELDSRLRALDEEYRKGLATCARRSIVVSHNAFGYLADRYGLRQVGITGLTPEEEPSAARLAEVAEFAKANDVKVIFFETLVSPRIAQALAREVGATAQVLDPLEGLEDPAKDDYFSVMRENLAALRPALSCS